MNLNGQLYYYEYNGQGDIIGLVDSNMNEVVTYSYDTWGNLLSIGGSLASTVGEINPFRYRGYYYDTETKLYYLNSRYYDPNTGRFLNADDEVDASGNLLGTNVFAYCDNNPVMRSDPSGQWSLFDTFCVCVAVTVLVVCILQPELIPAAAVALAEYGGAITAALTGAAVVADETAPEIGGAVNEAAQEIDEVTTAGAEDVSSTLQHVFYSGGDEAKAAASDFAAKNNGTIIDNTKLGIETSQQAEDMKWSDARPLWQAASKKFAETASGDVHVFIYGPKFTGLDSVFMDTELPTLLLNPNISSITIHIFGN